MDKDEAYFFDILEAAKIALRYVGKKTIENFEEDMQCQDAVIRRLEMIGEAAGRISQETIDNYPDLPWRKMKGMRNFLIHEYDDIDMTIVWETANSNLPPLIIQIENILKK